jgi:hypothetical protein
MVIVTTERLILRHWQLSDRGPFSRMNADPRVMEFMPSLLSRDESDALIDHIESQFRARFRSVCGRTAAGSLLHRLYRVGCSSLSRDFYPMRRKWDGDFRPNVGAEGWQRKVPGKLRGTRSETWDSNTWFRLPFLVTGGHDGSWKSWV